MILDNVPRSTNVPPLTCTSAILPRLPSRQSGEPGVVRNPAEVRRRQSSSRGASSRASSRRASVADLPRPQSSAADQVNNGQRGDEHELPGAAEQIGNGLGELIIRDSVALVPVFE